MYLFSLLLEWSVKYVSLNLKKLLVEVDKMQARNNEFFLCKHKKIQPILRILKAPIVTISTPLHLIYVCNCARFNEPFSNLLCYKTIFVQKSV